MGRERFEGIAQPTSYGLLRARPCGLWPGLNSGCHGNPDSEVGSEERYRIGNMNTRKM